MKMENDFLKLSNKTHFFMPNDSENFYHFLSWDFSFFYLFKGNRKKINIEMIRKAKHFFYYWIAFGRINPIRNFTMLLNTLLNRKVLFMKFYECSISEWVFSILSFTVYWLIPDTVHVNLLIFGSHIKLWFNFW